MTAPDERLSVLPCDLRHLHLELIGDDCSRSFGDEAMCLLDTVLRAVLL